MLICTGSVEIYEAKYNPTVLISPNQHKLLKMPTKFHEIFEATVE